VKLDAKVSYDRASKYMNIRRCEEASCAFFFGSQFSLCGSRLFTDLISRTSNAWLCLEIVYQTTEIASFRLGVRNPLIIKAGGRTRRIGWTISLIFPR
jgi:hypothetical protein